jgi:fermentation-respiration switch protein FrsA (DUF1100 family)
LLNGLGVLVLAILLVLALLWLVQRQLIYLPTQEVPAPPRGVEEVTFRTDDGLTLAAWLVPSQTGTERGTVLVFNGNAGNRAHRVPLGTALANQGFSVLLTDYRGYGGNPGSPSEEGLAMDGRAALEYLRSERGVALDRLAYLGESLGAGVAIGLAEEAPPAALVLRSPFASMADIASVHYAWVPASLLLRDRYPNVERIGGLDMPVLVIAGSDDRIVPIGQSRRVYEAAGEPKQLLVIEGARHNDLELLAGAEMISGISEFLLEALGPS